MTQQQVEYLKKDVSKSLTNENKPQRKLDVKKTIVIPIAKLEKCKMIEMIPQHLITR